MQIIKIKSSKTLYLIRHAKSCWNNQLVDYQRPINKRGIDDANIISKHLLNMELKPDLILCSASKRTKLTAEIFIKNLSLANVNTVYLKELYDFSGESLLQVIEGIKDSFDRVLIFGHNHALTNFVNTYGDKHIKNVTTSGFVTINFEISSWKNIKKGETTKIVFPKHLK